MRKWSASYTDDSGHCSRYRRCSVAGFCSCASRSRGACRFPRTASLAGQIQPIDVAAFRNLVDPAEDAYLRRRLPAAEFRLVRRERAASHGSLRSGGEKKRRRSGAHRTSRIELRAMLTPPKPRANWWTTRSCCGATPLLLYSEFILHWLGRTRGLAATPVLESYEQLNGSAMLLGRLQNPALPVRIAATE